MISRLNGQVADHTARQLKQLTARRGSATARARRPDPHHAGSCAFNLTLINRMDPDSSKVEPTFRQEQCSVSWHADSSLEHFSSIAVYHTTAALPPGQPPDWRIALRVAHDAEGPTAGKLKRAKPVDAPDEQVAPAVAVPLPSDSMYYLLDDFNHHHQHAVLTGDTKRFASTHRVSRREGHCFAWILDRCRKTLAASNKKTVKQIRAEQAALTEVETEWILQFYIQGKTHFDLHQWWHGPMHQLLDCWARLEEATSAVLRVLQAAAAVAAADRAPGVSRQRANVCWGWWPHANAVR